MKPISPRSLTDKAAAFEAVDEGSIPSGDTRKEKSKSFGSPRFARRLIRIQFWG